MGFDDVRWDEGYGFTIGWCDEIRVSGSGVGVERAFERLVDGDSVHVRVIHEPDDLVQASGFRLQASWFRLLASDTL